MNKWQTILLVLAIAMHNIPEGLAVGVAFGAIASPEIVNNLNIEIFTLGSAIALAIGIGIQNFPEGFAVSMPLRRQGMSKFKSWQWGQLSAIVEPIFAVIGAAIVLQVLPILPYALAFAAGAMIFIVIEGNSRKSKRRKYRFSNYGFNCRFYSNDGFRCRARLIKELSLLNSFLIKKNLAVLINLFFA